jgi:hypothetical protein
MNPRQRSKVRPEKQLCILAREFRGTRDERERACIAERYAEAVKQLINSKKWKRIPTLEDQLPDEWMPEQFFKFWSLQVPDRRAARTG